MKKKRKTIKNDTIKNDTMKKKMTWRASFFDDFVLSQHNHAFTIGMQSEFSFWEMKNAN